jgi:TolB-like protein
MKATLLAAAVSAALLAASCAGAPPPGAPASARPAVAVFDFEAKSADPQAAGIGADVAQSLTEALLKGGKLRPVERADLDKLLKEQELSLSGAVREEDALKIGRIAGARYILLGSVSLVADQVRINARLLDAETAEIVLADSAYGPRKDIFKIEETLARKLEAGIR